MKNKMKIIISWSLVLLWMIIIFLFSNMNTIESNEKSKEAIHKLIETTEKVGMTTEKTKEIQQSIINQLNKPLIKCMHFIVYLLLSLLLLNSLTKTKIKNKYFITIIICFIYATLDEYHQTFIIGRTGQFIDVLIDSFGSLLGMILSKVGKRYQKKKTLHF